MCSSVKTVKTTGWKSEDLGLRSTNHGKLSFVVNRVDKECSFCFVSHHLPTKVFSELHMLSNYWMNYWVEDRKYWFVWSYYGDNAANHTSQTVKQLFLFNLFFIKYSWTVELIPWNSRSNCLKCTKNVYKVESTVLVRVDTRAPKWIYNSWSSYIF